MSRPFLAVTLWPLERWPLTLLTVALLAAPQLAARPTDPDSDLFTFDAGDDVLVYDTDAFKIHYTVAGTHAVPVADADGGGVPDHVERLGAIYQAALSRYRALGFKAPLSDVDLAADGLDDGGDGRFDVYLVDFGLSADGAFRSDRCDGELCIGHMVQENDFRGYGYPNADVGNRTVGSHELFHAVQAAYDAGQGAVMAEGTAVWASEQFDASLFDLEGFSGGYLDDASAPLDSSGGGAVDPFGYGAAIFFQYLGERFGADVVLHLWEAVEAPTPGSAGDDDPFWFDVIDGVLQADAGVSFAEVFADFAVATVFTDGRHDDALAAAGQGFGNGDAYAERPAEELDLPAERPSFVVFTSSSRFLHVPARGRERLRLRLLDDAQLEGLSAVLFAIDLNSGVVREARSGAVVPGEGLDVGLDIALDIGVDDDVFALLINARQRGQGARPDLCLGDDDEVEACVAALAGEGGEGEGEEGGEGGEGEGPSLGGGGCGCGQAPAATGLWGLGAGLLALGRRRGQRRP